MRIDAHQHFWTLARGDYGWLTPETGSIYRDFLPDDLEPLLDGAGIEGTLLVQAAPTVEETRFLLDLARANRFVKGVVGWVDFAAHDVAQQIARLALDGMLVGLRPMIQDIPDPNWMLDRQLDAAYDALQAHDLTFDALTRPAHLPALHRLLDRHPKMRVVIDHGSKPDIRGGAFKGWACDMRALAQETSAFCKLSGLVTEAGAEWQIDDLRPYVDHLLDSFGPARLIWGSDWPVCTLASSYERWLETTDALLADLTTPERDAVLGGNAARAYNLGT